jgi:hypothetical protein
MTRNYCALGVFMTRIAKACPTTVEPVRGIAVSLSPALRSSAGMVAVAALVLSACSTSNAGRPQGASTDSERTFATTSQVLGRQDGPINDLPGWWKS